LVKINSELIKQRLRHQLGYTYQPLNFTRKDFDNFISIKELLRQKKIEEDG